MNILKYRRGLPTFSFAMLIMIAIEAFPLLAVFLFLQRRKLLLFSVFWVGCGHLPDSIQSPPSSTNSQQKKTWVGTYDVNYNENKRFCGKQLTGSEVENVEAHIYASSIPRDLVFARGVYHDVVTKTTDLLYGTKIVTVDKLDIDNRQYSETTYYSVRLSGENYEDVIVRSEIVSGIQSGGCTDVIQEIRGTAKKADEKDVSCVERDPLCKDET